MGMCPRVPATQEEDGLLGAGRGWGLLRTGWELLPPPEEKQFHGAHSRISVLQLDASHFDLRDNH